MEIYPAIDLIGGRVVRLTKGDYNTAEKYADNPEKVLADFLKQGTRNLHVVDLDGAKSGNVENFEAIKNLAKHEIFIEVGGGIRNEETIKKYINIGVNRVILGTVAIKNFDFVKKMVKIYGDKIAVGIDALNSYVAIDGWQTVTDISSFKFCKRCRDAGVKTVIYTDIATDGTLKGTNLKAYQKLKEIKGLSVIASGGISSDAEIKKLKDMDIYGAIIGKSLYYGLVDLKRAIKIGDGEL